jgi:phospholipid/cholesterol/gamma-HCH transport system ATP-binding protein
MSTETIIAVKDLKVVLGKEPILNGIDLDIKRGEVFGIVGGSGVGKTTLLREMLLLEPPESGSICIFNQELTQASTKIKLQTQRRWGVLFQQNALFSSLTVLENVAFPLREHTTLNNENIKELALSKILLVGLSKTDANKYPAELSGGMEKRVALARAIVLDPEILFLDEPTTGLDPHSANALDELILKLQATMGLTIVVITHDLDTLWRVTDRVAFLDKGKVICIEPIEELAKNSTPVIRDFFTGPRGLAAAQKYLERE